MRRISTRIIGASDESADWRISSLRAGKAFTSFGILPIETLNMNRIVEISRKRSHTTAETASLIERIQYRSTSAERLIPHYSSV